MIINFLIIIQGTNGKKFLNNEVRMSRKKIAVAVILLNMIWSVGCGQILNASIGMEINTKSIRRQNKRGYPERLNTLDSFYKCLPNNPYTAASAAKQ